MCVGSFLLASLVKKSRLIFDKIRRESSAALVAFFDLNSFIINLFMLERNDLCEYDEFVDHIERQTVFSWPI